MLVDVTFPANVNKQTVTTLFRKQLFSITPACTESDDFPLVCRKSADDFHRTLIYYSDTTSTSSLLGLLGILVAVIHKNRLFLLIELI